MMNKISSCLKWTWPGGPSPGLCHAMMTEVAPPVASVVRSTSMSRPKGLIDNACVGVTTTGCNGVRASMDLSPVLHDLQTARDHSFTRAHRTPGRGRFVFSRVVPLVAYGLYAIDTALHSPSLRQLSVDPPSQSVPPAQTSL